MSRWLKNVGNFLDQLDNTAAVAVTAAVNGPNDDDDDLPLDENLLYRSVDSPSLDDNAGEESYLLNQTHFDQNVPSSSALEEDVSVRQTEVIDKFPCQNEMTSDIEAISIHSNDPKNGPDIMEHLAHNTDNLPSEMPDSGDTSEIITSSAVSLDGTENKIPETPFQTPQQIPRQKETSDEVIHAEDESDSKHILDLQQELQQYQQRFNQLQQEKQHEVAVLSKEARTLRRHLATLNEQLSAADKEVGAQRVELENAAARLESDRLKYKQDLQNAASKHAMEIQKLSRSHQDAVAVVQAQLQSQVESLKRELQELHARRKQEGGDLNKELEDAIHREKLALEKCSLQEEKNATLMDQIAYLQAQQETIGCRLESLTTMADSASLREREAEVRLDDAISLHARQISQRNAREAELERTVSELSAALVAERAKRSSVVVENENQSKQAPGDITAQDSNTVLELEAIKAQLEVERQQNAALHHELNESIQERQEEHTLAQTRHAHHEQKISELTQQLLELRSSLRDTKQESSGRRKSDEASLDTQRIQELTEELVRLRERMSMSNSETAALRNRLQVALNRAVVAEAAAESAFSISDPSGKRDIEKGNVVRRRGNTKSANSIEAPTIRSALRLDGLQSSGISTSAHGIGKGLDILDSFLATSGEILRFNPFARLLFVLYLLFLHFWSFALLFFHAHGFETVHGDFGAGGPSYHGPSALMQKSAVLSSPGG